MAKKLSICHQTVCRTPKRYYESVRLPTALDLEDHAPQRLLRTEEASRSASTGSLVTTCEKWPWSPRSHGNPTKGGHTNSLDTILTGSEDAMTSGRRIKSSGSQDAQPCLREPLPESTS
ncbi:hypothetical protein V3C99_000545 [Haemonchus contortus]